MPILLQDRDKYLLGLLADDFLLLTREQIQQLIPRGVRRTNQRLAILVKDKLLARREPVDRLSPNTIFYFLGEKAANVLNVDDLSSIRERRVRAKNFGDSYLRHLHLINAVHIKFLTNKEKDYEFRSWTPYDNTNWEGVGSLKLRPDGFVIFEKRNRQFCYFVEVDRGTERGASIRKKIEQYHAFDFSGSFWEEFKHDWFRVLFITTEASRSAALLKIFPSKIFWTATAAEILSRTLFEPCWTSREGTSLALNLGPDAEQAGRAEKRKAALLVLSATAPAPQSYIRPQTSTKKTIAEIPIPVPKKNWNIRFWFKLAKYTGIPCIAIIFGIFFYRAIARILTEQTVTAGSQIYGGPGIAIDPTWAMVLIAVVLIVAKFLINAVI